MRILALWLLATWCAECVWGGFTIVDYPAVAVFLGPMYGGAAVLIREVARRRGGGWPSIVLLAAAFGLVQAGLVDQSLFDREGLAGTAFAEWNRAAGATLVPVFGFSAEQLLDFVGNHVLLSICAPIAVVESFGGRGPWLSRRLIVLLAVLYVGSSLLIRSDTSYVPSPAQVWFVLVVAGCLVVAALVRRPAMSWRGRPVMSPPVLGAVVLVVQVGAWFSASPWLGVVQRVVALVLVAVLALGWARSQRHVVAVVGAGLVLAGVAAFLSPPYELAAPWLMVLSDVVGAVVVVVVLSVAYRRSSRSVPAVGVPG